MNKFELFCLLFYALDAQWDETKNEDLGNYLSGANPFLFSDMGSAVPDCYENFCRVVGDENIDLEDSYRTAENYVMTLGITAVEEAFKNTSEQQWCTAAKKYLSAPHKGA